MKTLRLFLAFLTAFSAPMSAFAQGKLDLPLLTPIKPPASENKDVPPLPIELWAPGSPLAERGASRNELMISHTGYATMGAFGIAQSAGDFGRSNDAKAATIGFGAMTLLQLWGLWKTKDAPDDKR